MGKTRNKELEELLHKIKESGWAYTIHNEPESSLGGMHHNERNYAELEKHSPAGEDFIMIIDFDKKDPVNSFLENLKDYADSFDPEEHAEMFITDRGKNGVPDSVRELLDDADAIKEMVSGLYDELSGQKAVQTHQEDNKMDEKIKTLMDILTEAYNNTEHCIKNPYYYSLSTCYNSKSVGAGVDKNMEEYIKKHTPKDIYDQYDWYKSSKGRRMYISLKQEIL